MPLLNKKILNDLEQNKYAFDDIIPNDAPVIVKYFNPVYFGSWFFFVFFRDDAVTLWGKNKN